ncbi:hypothetical protein B0A48_13387 [Cryoendolithus antarcticus]|uniref:DNA primase n=1 Tax=Cryoendolithus antarcticus TaxID=1507870 RepID=A0A1V8SQ36_9PEZI|nr:hypothetical protein B0A48_13387 [Cryoendolithus antarcticus]
MPHAISPTSSPPEPVMDDTIMSNAPAQPLEDEVPLEPHSDAAMLDAEPSTVDTSSGKLEDIFDDDSDNDEFSSSVPTTVDSSQPALAPAAQEKSAFTDLSILKQFYQRLLPFRALFQWLNHSASPCADFQHREFAFTLQSDVYVRYQSFASADLFRKACVNTTPLRFEIGPQYTINPRDRKTVLKAGSFRPVMKELVFDIDMTDYDPIRTCCTGAKICHKCWQFIIMAIKVVDVALREDFGFQHVLWVYSGRRGAHAWVSDKRARTMDDAKRRAIANYLVLKQDEKKGIRRPLHPHLDRSLDLLNPHFTKDVLSVQDPWATAEQASKLLDLLPDKVLTTALQKKWDSAPNRSSAQKWADIDSVAENGNLSTMSPKQLVDTRQDIRLEYTYPRLDAEVSKKLNHLLKSPFVIHPGTGRVCVPIDVRRLEDFDPFAVPTVTQLLQEIDTWDAEARRQEMSEEEKSKVEDWQKTRLKPYVEYFRGYVAALLKDESRVKRERDEEAGAESMEF